MALALARKYRPRSFDDLVGQESVSITLSQALDSGRLTHAYLFSGLRGSGKTSTARIFAKALLCERGPSSRPCEECLHCTMANENRHMDIIEMDAASNRGIDDIKELIEHTRYKPGSGRFKIFIIDEVHMLTTQAFNALLKTLEEPPDFVKFILATTDPLKLPATILSRTQHFRFKKISRKLVHRHLEHILNLEKIAYESDALEIIARSGAGSLRDSLTLLDQAIVYSKEKIDIATVTGMLGIIEPAALDNLLDAIFHKDRERILSFIASSTEYEAEMIIDELTLHIKELLLNREGPFTPMILDRFFRILADARSLLHIGSDGEFVISLTLFKMLEALNIREIDETIAILQKELSSKGSPAVVTTPATVERASSSAGKADMKASGPEAASEDGASITQRGGDTGELKFKTLIAKLYDRDYDLGSCFEKNIRFKSYEGSTLSWISSAEGEERKMLITHWSLIRTFVQEIYGLSTKISNIPAQKSAETSPGEDKKKADDISSRDDGEIARTERLAECELPDNASGSGTLESVEFPTDCEKEEKEASIEKEPSKLLDEAMVKEAIELFGAKKVRIRRKN